MSVTLKPGSIGNWNIGTFKARLRKHIPEQLAAAGGVSALNNQAENRLVTIGATTTELDGEANLTFDGSTLKTVSGAHVSSSGDVYVLGSISGSNNLSIGGNLEVSGTFSPAAVSTSTVSSSGDIYALGSISGSNNLAIGGNMHVTGALSLGGNATINGSTTLGNANSDIATVSGQLTGSEGILIKDDKYVFLGNDEDAKLVFDSSTYDGGMIQSDKSFWITAPSAGQYKPELVLAGDYNGSGGANLTFATSRAGSVSTDGDTLGNITWQDGSSAGAGTYAEIYAAADDAAGNKDASVYISCMVNNSAVNIATFGGYSGTTRYGLILPNDSTVGAAKAHSWGTYSDESFKKNIVPIESSLDKVIQLQGVTYDWKTDGTSDIGFIAQNVKKIIPQVVRGDEGEYGLDYGKITAVLAEAVKELNDKIESQKIIISQLTDKIEDLKK